MSCSATGALYASLWRYIRSWSIVVYACDDDCSMYRLDLNSRGKDTSVQGLGEIIQWRDESIHRRKKNTDRLHLVLAESSTSLRYDGTQCLAAERESSKSASSVPTDRLRLFGIPTSISARLDRESWCSPARYRFSSLGNHSTPSQSTA